LKSGANFEEINEIRRSITAGEKIKAISQRMNIKLHVVEAFSEVELTRGQKAAATRAANRAAQEDS